MSAGRLNVRITIDSYSSGNRTPSGERLQEPAREDWTWWAADLFDPDSLPGA